MKKVFLSAIMMVTFSGVIRANDIAEKELEPKICVEQSGEEHNVCKIILNENCNLVQFRMYNIGISLGYNHELANNFSYIAYYQCVYNNLKKMDPFAN